MDTRQGEDRPRSSVWRGLLIGALIGLAVGLSLLPVRSAPDPNALKVQGPDTIGNLLPVQQIPPGPTLTVFQALTASSANAAATNNNTLAASAGIVTFCSGFEITGAGATAGSVITVTLTGTAGGTLNYQLVIPTGATVSITPLIVEFNPPIPASAVATAITINVPSFGAGNTNAAVVIHGFRQ